MFFIANTPNGKSSFFDEFIRDGKIEDAKLLSIEPQHGVVGLHWSVKLEPPVERITITGRFVYSLRERSPLRGQSKRAKRRAELRQGGAV